MPISLHSVHRLAAAAGLLCLAALSGAAAVQAADSERTLYVWAGDVSRQGPDFLTVVDFDPASATYGKPLSRVELPEPGASGNEPHHVGLSSDGRVLALGGLLSILRGQPEVFFFDVSKPRTPRFLRAADPPQSSITDEFYPIPGGGFLVTMMGGAAGASPGRVAAGPGYGSLRLRMRRDTMGAVKANPAEVEAFQRFEREGWDRAAHLYDSAWGTLTPQFIAPLVEAAGIAPGQRVLDLACGPGYVAAAAVARGAEVIGVDLSPAMVREARRRHPGIDFRAGSAESLDFAAESFDRVLLNFGVLHLADPQAAFAEAQRLLRPSGRLAFTLWAPPEKSPGARVMSAAVEAHALPAEDLPAGPPAFHYTDRDLCRQALAEAGFDPGSVRFSIVEVSWRVPSPEFLFEAELRAGVRTAALLARQSPEVLAAIRHDIERAVADFATGDGYALPMTAYVVVAEV